MMMAVFSSCGKQTATEPERVIPAGEPQKQENGTQLGNTENKETVVDTREDRYSARLVDILYSRKKENIVVSDLSLKMALSMCLEGAEGSTKEEMLSYFGAKDEKEAIEKMTQVLLSQQDDEVVKMLLANMILFNKDIKLRDEYIKKIEKDFDISPMERELFSPDTVDEINGFVNENTKGLIKEIVKLDNMEDLKVFLVNTLYFKGQWAHEIDYSEYEDIFHGLSKDKKSVFYNDTVDTYFENDKAYAFSKQYYGNYEFIGILPKEDGDFSLEELDITGLLASRDSESYDVDIILPKLDLEYGGDITDAVIEDGLGTAFNPMNADFSGMSDADQLYFSMIIHKTRLKLDGKGTEAAAVTAIGMKANGMFIPVEKEKKEVFLTRPFAFIIYDYENDVALFTGKVIDL
jgi:serpin B